MSLTGDEFEQFSNALMRAFPSSDRLTHFIRIKLNENLEKIAGKGALDIVTFHLVDWAESTGRTTELLQQARKLNPGNPELRTFEADYAAARRPDPGHGLIASSGEESRASDEAAVETTRTETSGEARPSGEGRPTPARDPNGLTPGQVMLLRASENAFAEFVARWHRLQEASLLSPSHVNAQVSLRQSLRYVAESLDALQTIRLGRWPRPGFVTRFSTARERAVKALQGLEAMATTGPARYTELCNSVEELRELIKGEFAGRSAGDDGSRQFPSHVRPWGPAN